MMIGPESYYELYLKDKSAEEIMKCIRSLKNEIRRKKRLLETPRVAPEEFINPGPLVIIAMDREYLEYAKKAYAEAGGEYVPTQSELKATKFNEDVDHIIEFKFAIGGYFSGYETRTVTVDKDIVIKNFENPFRTKPSNACAPNMPFETKKEFFDGVRDLNLGEWKRKYSDPLICDGTQWEIEITFDNGGKPFKCWGSNAYPYNFRALCELLGADSVD